LSGDSERFSDFADSHLQKAVVRSRVAVESALPSRRLKGSQNAARREEETDDHAGPIQEVSDEGVATAAQFPRSDFRLSNPVGVIACQHVMQIVSSSNLFDRTVTLRMMDGETAKVKVDFVDEEYEDIIAAVVETSCPEHCRAPCAIQTFAAADIVSAELSE
jgi:hypothetical protein